MDENVVSCWDSSAYTLCHKQKIHRCVLERQGTKDQQKFNAVLTTPTLFQEDEDGASQAHHPPQQPETYPSDEEEDGEFDDEIFIVDEEGKPYARQKKKPVFEDEGLEAARDIFGCDFDYGEFEQYEGEG